MFVPLVNWIIAGPFVCLHEQRVTIHWSKKLIQNIKQQNDTVLH